ncbi:uncharacterized protein LY89DRAFT_620308 [Mollisia scopiformis]|uniref:Uncharacterized protein n=1 Tax=Mollisia scopiformis TaxID=149040 RepID=A0A194X5E5_MOLSC|nr:uncharacterized protein LY89DRAFT_620308 [Mollisia scopiformis]KUJ15037.1 hypothetical protein LY89DRAFT_620308 [Mollisia scopiformis]
MSLVSIRDLVAIPTGDNSSDTIIDGIHWNLTALQNWNYTYYSNRTFSNGSSCLLVFEPYTPILLPNGTFLNSTSCYSPVNPLKARSKIGLFFACFFAISIMFTSINLRKHGRLFLPTEKRFLAIGRRWQWYWMFIVAAFAIISSITGVDVDRYYLPELPIVLSSFFWFLMLPTTMCIVWESVRHWGSWQERQMIDPNPFQLSQDDRRTRIELLVPLVFYFFAWVNFFMVVPRSWSAIERQRDPEQTRLKAEPVATDARFKAAALLLFCSWCTIIFSLWHSIKHYKERNRGYLNRAIGFVQYVPKRFLLTLALSLIMIGYEAACSFEFSISPLKLDTKLGYMYGLGWAPIALIFIVYEVAGYLEPNEDKELIRQRRIRGAEIDHEIGIVKKPHWWSRLNRDNRSMSIQDQITRNVNHVGGGPPTARNLERNIELGIMPVSKGVDANKPAANTEAIRAAANLLFPARSDVEETQERFTDYAEPSRGRSIRPRHETDRSESHESQVTTGAKPQEVRSMLDI